MLLFLAGFLTCLIVVGIFRVLGKRYSERSGLTTSEVLTYLKYANNALWPGGIIQVNPSGSQGDIEIQKPRNESTVTDLVLRVRSGDFGREQVSAVATAATAASIKCRMFRTPKQGLFKEARFPIDITGSEGIARFQETLEFVAKCVSRDETPTFRVRCVGMYRPGFLPEDGAVIPHHFSTKLGFFVGRTLRVLVDVVRSIR